MKKGFTMAEVLITLGVIGIVAAMTLPSLIAKHQKKVVVTRLKKSYTILNQWLIKSQLVNGAYDTWPVGKDVNVNDYFNRYIKPFFNGVKVCTLAEDCGYTSDKPWKNLSGSTVNWGLKTDNTRILFLLNDGTAVFIPRNTFDASGGNIYVNQLYMYVDVNGALSPNTLGHDVFIFRMDDKNTLRPLCYNKTEDYIKAHCAKNGDITRNENCCTDKIMADGWEIKSDYPW